MNKRTEDIIRLLSEAYPKNHEEPKASDPFRALIGCILSQRTRDQNSVRAAERLLSRASSPREIAEMPMDELHDLIRCSGFYRQKAAYIAGTCRALLDRHGGEVPKFRADLMDLPGVGPKTADIVISYGHGSPSMPVDVHVSRVSRRLGLAPMDGSRETVKEHLERTLPQELWGFYDRSAVELGKQYCRKTGPRCSECPLRGVCQWVRVSTE